MSTSIFHFYNRYHIGDNLLNLKYFLYLSTILKEKNIVIYYYYDTKWTYNKKETLLSYIDPSVVTIKPLSEAPPTSIELWMGNKINGVDHLDSERYYDLFYKKILNYFSITDPSLSTNIWLDEPFLETVYESLDAQYKDIDILLLNTVGKSGQFNNTTTLNSLARYLHKHFNIVTADDIGGGVKTAQQLSLKQIGAISTHSKYIISTCSGPQIPCFNKQARDYVKKWFLITDGCHFKYYSIDYMYTSSNTTPIKAYFDALVASQ